MAFDPDKYLASKTKGSAAFDPDAYIASKETPQPSRPGMTFTPDDPNVERGRKLIKERNIGMPGAVARGVAESQFMGKGEEVIGMAKGAASAVTGQGPDTLQAIEDEKAIQAAIREDQPLEFAAGEMIGFFGSLPAKGMALVGKGLSAVGTKAIPIVQKIYPGVTNPTVLNQMAKAFVVGGTELGLFEAAKETLESGDLKKAAKKGATGFAVGGAGGAAIAGVMAPFTRTQAEKAIAKGLEVANLEKQAAKEGDKAVKLTKQILNEDNPQILNAITKDPKRVKELVESGPIDDFTLGQRMLKEYTQLKDALVASVGKKKRALSKDTTPSIDTGFFRKALEAVEKKLTTTEGKTVLTQADQQEIQAIKDLLYPQQISASDAVLVADKIQAMVKFGQREASNISEQAAKGLKLVRRAIKTKLHVRYPEYSQADDALSAFLSEAEKIETPLNNNAEQFVKNMFGSGKTQLRNSLIKLRGLAKRIDPATAEGTLNLARDVSSARAARTIREGLYPAKRTTQEISNEIVRKYSQKGAVAGSSIGTAIGLKIGGLGGAAAGGTAGAFVGRQLGSAIGKSIGNPMRVINAALRSKDLSARAKMLAKEIEKVVIEQGPSSFSQMMDFIPISAKGADELADFIINNSSLKTTDVLNDDELTSLQARTGVNQVVDGALSSLED